MIDNLIVVPHDNEDDNHNKEGKLLIVIEEGIAMWHFGLHINRLIFWKNKVLYERRRQYYYTNALPSSPLYLSP